MSGEHVTLKLWWLSMDPIETSWVSGGGTYTLNTEHLGGETRVEQQARHDEALAYWQGIYPED